MPCAARGVRDVRYDEDRSPVMLGMEALAADPSAGVRSSPRPVGVLRRKEAGAPLPSFREIRERLVAGDRFCQADRSGTDAGRYRRAFRRASEHCARRRRGYEDLGDFARQAGSFRERDELEMLGGMGSFMDILRDLLDLPDVEGGLSDGGGRRARLEEQRHLRGLPDGGGPEDAGPGRPPAEILASCCHAHRGEHGPGPSGGR